MQQKSLTVLSLFDGISSGQLALQRAGVQYDNYYASEIDPHAIKVTQHHFPSTVQLGDVQNVKAEDLPKIDLLCGGFPCQSFSSAGKGLGFDDPRGQLFWHTVRLLKELQPQFFLFENVVMSKANQAVITEALGVEPIEIDSALVTAQHRRRLYWTNIPFDKTIEDKGVVIADILDPTGDGLVNKACILGRRLNSENHREDYNKSIRFKQCIEVRASNPTKSNCLTTFEKDNVLTSLPVGRHPNAFSGDLPFRYYTTKEKCRLQTIPVNYFDNLVSDNAATKLIGNGWTVDVVAHIFRGLL